MALDLEKLPLGSIVKQSSNSANKNNYTKETGGWKATDGRLVTHHRMADFGWDLVEIGSVRDITAIQALVQILVDSVEQADENTKRLSVDSNALLLLAEALEIDTFHFVAE